MQVVLAHNSVMKLMLAVRFAFEEGDSISVTDYSVKDGTIRTLPNTHIQLSEVSRKSNCNIEVVF